PYGGLGGKAGRADFASRAARSLTPPSQLADTCPQLPRSLRDRLDALVLRGLALDPDQRHSDPHRWLAELHDLSARFRVTPELPPVENALTRVIEWFVKPRTAPEKSNLP